MASESSFKLTYATMFNPPEELHQSFEQALAKLRANLGQEYAMIIDGKEVFAAEKLENRNPANTDELLGIFQKGTAADANAAVAAARRAFKGWSRTPWQERVRLVRKAAEIMDERTYEMGAVVSLEVGKNRMEGLGDVAETA
ncbi:MAG: aldehyde dehydrogenase family protein, partial [Dehalococcoidia bacterium]